MWSDYCGKQIDDRDYSTVCTVIKQAINQGFRKRMVL